MLEYSSAVRDAVAAYRWAVKKADLASAALDAHPLYTEDYRCVKEAVLHARAVEERQAGRALLTAMENG